MSLMNKDPRKSVAALILKMREKADGTRVEERTPPSEELDSDIGLITAAEDIMQALDSKDAKTLVSGMKAMHDMIAMETRSEEASSEPESTDT